MCIKTLIHVLSLPKRKNSKIDHTKEQVIASAKSVHSYFLSFLEKKLNCFSVFIYKDYLQNF